MKNICFLYFLLVFTTIASAQHESNAMIGKIKGSITDLLTGHPLEEASISISYREVSYTDLKEPVLNSIQESMQFSELLTDENGEFEVEIKLREKTDYFNLKVESTGKETLFNNIVVLAVSETTTLYFRMTPAKPSLIEEKKIEEILTEEINEKDFAKMMDYENLVNVTATKIFPENEPLIYPKTDVQPCSFSSIPENVYVKNLHNGYNGSTSGDGFTGYINFDEYVAGAVQGEIGGITIHMQTKKAQAIAGRTYSMNRHIKSLPVNIGQAFQDNISSSSMNASLFTTQEIMLYEGNVIDAKYSARCNGDYTQNANEGTWSPYSNCNTTGNFIPYLVSRPCSGHSNCGQTTESPCCNVIISTSGVSGYIYGHGVGMCQRGIEQWGEIYNLDYCDILHKYYTNICITNDHCGSGSSVLDCADAVSLSCGVAYQGGVSSNASHVDYYGCNDWTQTGPERVHTIIPSVDGTLTASISNFTGDLDVYILGSCDPTDCLGEVSSSEAIYTNSKAGQTYFIVVDADDGSGSDYELLVTCEEHNIEDITISDQHILSTSTVEPGSKVDVQANQNYKGNSNTLPDISLHYYLSYDCVYDESDVFLDENYSTINASNLTETELTTITIPVNTMPGIYFILFVGDATDAVNEIDEENNMVCKQINVQSSEAVKVYPNPTNSLIQFESYYSPIVKLEIYNDMGQLIGSFNEPENSINISIYPVGIYMLKFIDSNNKSTFVKILKR